MTSISNQGYDPAKAKSIFPPSPDIPVPLEIL
jgi:hypothetical protein